MTNTHKNKNKKQTKKQQDPQLNCTTLAQFVEDPGRKIKARTRPKVSCKVLTFTIQHISDNYGMHQQNYTVQVLEYGQVSCMVGSFGKTHVCLI